MLAYLRKKSSNSQDLNDPSGKENVNNMKPQPASSYTKAFSAKLGEGGSPASADDDWGPVGVGGGVQQAAAEDPTERQREYIAMLQERNR